jgi:hypothetical protein
MGVAIGDGAARRIAKASGTFAIQVREPSDLGTAIAAMILARIDVIELAACDGGAEGRLEVSPIVATPGGPLLLVEHCTAPRDVAASFPEIVARRLVNAGLAAATVDVPVLGGELNELDRVPNAVVLRLFPVPLPGATPSLPSTFLDAAARWVAGAGDGDDDTPVKARVLGVEFDVAPPDVATVLRECGSSRAWCDAAGGRFDDCIRSASLTFTRLPHVALAAAGPRLGAPGQLGHFDLLRDIARALAADAAYACLDFEATLEGLATGLSNIGWQQRGGAPANVVARELVDERVPDAYPYQVLGPRHLTRVATLATRPLPDGRAEIAFGEPQSWLVGTTTRSPVQAAAWQQLRPLLVAGDELIDLVSAESDVDLRGETGAIAPVSIQHSP